MSHTLATPEKAKSPVVSWLAAVSLALAVLWLYGPVVARLGKELAQSEDYSYGLLLPLVSGYLIYRKWPQIRALAWRPSWTGLAVMALGFALFIVGELAADLYVPRFSFVVVLAGLVFLVGGWGLVRLLAFSLILLVLMLPLPELITYKLTLPLQLISSRLATWFLQTLGVPVLQQGNIIDLGVRQLQVVAACSGLRYILPLLALGMIYCSFYQRRPWKVAVLLATLVPLAILFNALRVAGMGLYPSLMQGFWHAVSGWLIFILCMSALAGLDWILNRFWPQLLSSKPNQAPAIPSQMLPEVGLNRYLLAALGLMLVTLPLAQRVSVAPPVPLKQSFEHFPLQLESWQGRLVPVDPEEVRATRSHAHLSAEYTNPQHGPVSLWIAYYETQKKAGGFVHSPKGCLTASGWQTLDTGIYQIAPGQPVNYLLVEKMGTRMVVFYWYLQRGRWLTSEYFNKFYMGYDGLLRRRTDGALIRLVTPAGNDLPGAQERLDSFARQLSPIIQKFIPN